MASPLCDNQDTSPVIQSAAPALSQVIHSEKNTQQEYLDGRVILHPGDCMAVLAGLPDNSVDAVCTDPPYHLTSIVKRFGAENAAPAKVGKTGAYARASRGFMGKVWDGGDIAFTPELWAKVLRVLKPGGHMVAFSGTRTYHRMACAIEDAGFEIRDQLAWTYGSGFPKSHDAAQSIEKLLTTGNSRRPDRDLGGLDRNRFSGSVEGTLIANTGGKVELTTPEAKAFEGWGTALKPAWEPICLARKPLSEGTVAANVLRWGTGAINVDACRVAAGAGDYDHPGNDRSDKSKFGFGFGQNNQRPPSALGRFPANLVHDGSPEVLAGFPDLGKSTGGRIGNAGGGSVENIPTGTFAKGDPGFGDSGSAARFFYTAKADAEDRIGSKHPTVKPVDLMQWLVRLICPKGGTVLDPFAGTGTTGAAAFIEGMRAVLIEREAEYQADITRRMELLLAGPDERRGKTATQEPHHALPLFGGA